MKKEFDTYELDEIIDKTIEEVNNEINEQFSGPQYQQYNPEQLSVLNLLRRAQQTPQGSSTLADILRGAYSLPGTDDEIPPIPPEHLQVKDVYIQTLMFAMRAAFLAVSPPARIYTLARLMFDTPHPRTATELITTIAGIWGNAAKDIVDDAAIRAYRALDYSINKIAIPIMTPFLAFFASGALATAIEGRIGGSLLTTLENPQEVNKNLATNFKYADKVLLLKGQMKDDKLFVGSALELIQFLQNYANLYNSGMSVWRKFAGDPQNEDFIQLIMAQWNSTIGSYDEKLKITSLDNMFRLEDRIRRDHPLPNELKQSVFDFFSGVKFDEAAGWTVIAGMAGASSIPLPFIQGESPIIVNGKEISKFTPNGFFDTGAWNAAFWKFWSNDLVASVWSGVVSSSPEAFFDNDEFLNKFVSTGNTVLSTNPSLRSQFISQGKTYYENKYGPEEGAQKLQALQSILSGQKVDTSGEEPAGEEESEMNSSNMSALERKFISGEAKYEDFAQPVTGLTGQFKSLQDEIILTPAVAKAIENFAKRAAKADIFNKGMASDIRGIFSTIKKLYDQVIPNELATIQTMARSRVNDTNLEGEEASNFMSMLSIGTDSNEELDDLYRMGGIYFAALVLQEQSKRNIKDIGMENILNMLKSLS